MVSKFSMDIILVEDDHNQAEWMIQALKKRLPKANLRLIKTEHDFMDAIDEFEREPPAVIVLDIMLRWADAAPLMPEPPEEVVRNKHYRAGIRCVRELQGRKAAKNIPIVLYTILDRRDIRWELDEFGDGPLFYIPKGADLTPFLDGVSHIIQQRRVDCSDADEAA